MASITFPSPAPLSPFNYLHPDTSNPVQSPMPTMENHNLVTGIYYNVLFPIERQNQEWTALMSYLFNILEGKTPDFITAAQFETLNAFCLQSAPRKAFSCLLATYTLEQIQLGKHSQDALAIAQKKLEVEGFPEFKRGIELLKKLQAKEGLSSPPYHRFAILIESINACVNDFENVLSHNIKLIREEFKKGSQEGLLLLEQSKKRTQYPKIINLEKILERFENRLKIIEQVVDDILDKTPNAATFLAFQEATPDAVEEMKACWKDRKFTWISFNNISDEETTVKTKENLFGEATAFTSTLALSPAFKILRTSLESLPTLSGSFRKIMGVEVLNTNTNSPLAIFTTHTDHLIQGDLYQKTADAIHRFITAFLEKTPNMPRVLGGDFNAFETSGGGQLIQRLREGPFAGGQDYREGEAFYVPKSIADSTFLGNENDRFKAALINGKVEANSLDYIITNRVKVIAGTRSAAVYDAESKLVDPYNQAQIYQDRLERRKTASDHFLNAIVFHD